MSANKMSHDRVHFTVKESYLQKDKIRICIAETLGISERETHRMARQFKNLHVICRPSQFARFVILRHIKYGEPNNMACLDMKLVKPTPELATVDVSHIPNCAGSTEE